MGEAIAMSTLVQKGRQLRFRLHKTDRTKTLALRVQQDGGVDVRAPRFIKIEQVRRFVARRADWILDKQNYFAEFRRKYPPKDLKNGETFPLLGRRYRLRLEHVPGLSECFCRAEGHRLTVFVDGQVGEALKNATWQALRAWYSALTEKKVRAVIRKHARSLAVEPGSLKVVEQTKRWASCSKGGDIRCNWRLSMMPGPVLEYIVVHELCHLKTHDHSAGFWRILKSVLPDYEKRRDWLRHQGPAIAAMFSSNK